MVLEWFSLSTLSDDCGVVPREVKVWLEGCGVDLFLVAFDLGRDVVVNALPEMVDMAVDGDRRAVDVFCMPDGAFVDDVVVALVTV